MLERVKASVNVNLYSTLLHSASDALGVPSRGRGTGETDAS